MTKQGSYWAYVLDEESRTSLLKRFPPKFSNVIAHHITVCFGKVLPPSFTEGHKQDIDVAWYCSDSSLEAVEVRVGSIARPDGKPFHITLSLDRDAGRKPVDSNAVLASANMIPVIPVLKLTGTLQFC